MEAAGLSAIQLRIDRRQVGLVALLLVLALIGWVVTDDRMAGMDAGPGTDLGSLGFYVTAWVVMMAAMMFPSAAPMVVAYADVQGRRRELGKQGAGRGATAVFVGGYLLSWTAFGLLAYALLELIRSLDVEAFAWGSGGPYLAGGIIVAAAIYQLTPVKDVCLSHCRGPLAFIAGHFRPGYGGALRTGLEHGGWCVGCCWALMAALFAVGIMSVGWMVFVAALIAIEKMLPWKVVANRGIALLLLALGLSVAFWPERVPGLTLPDSAKAHEAMMHMEGGSMTDDSMKRDSTPGGSTSGDSMKGDTMKEGSMKKESMKMESMPR